MSSFEDQYAAFSSSRSYRHWIATQRIGLQAHLLKVADNLGNDPERQQRWDELKQMLPPRPGSALNGFPPSVLHLLRQSLSIPSTELGEPAGTLEAYRREVVNVLSHLEGGREDDAPTEPTKRSSLGIAQVIAYNIMSGVRSAKSIFRLGFALCRGGARTGWRRHGRDEKSKQTLENALEVLRSPSTSVFEKMRVISELSDRFLHSPDEPDSLPAPFYWSQVRNALFHQVLSWPLLLIRAREASGQKQPAISVPVAIDLSFDGKSRCTIRPLTAREPLASWKMHLEKALDAAKALWFASHNNYREFWSEVKTASVIFHFDVAQEILQSLPLKDGSAEAYFAQVIFARLLGRSGFISSAGSAQILRVAKLRSLPADVSEELLTRTGCGLIQFVPPSERPPGWLVWKGRWRGSQAQGYRRRLLDLSSDEAFRKAVDSLFLGRPTLILGPVDGIREKLSWVFGSQSFERVVLSKSKEVVREAAAFIRTLRPPDKKSHAPSQEDGLKNRGKLRPTAEVIYAPRADHMADIMQIGGWRRYRYVRCPDLLWGLHGEYDRERPGLLRAASHPEVQALVEKLARNRSPVLEISESPQLLVSALQHINETLPTTFPSRTPPRFSWAVVRVVPEEMDTRFWRVIFNQVIGAPSDVFEKFVYNSSTPEEAACQLAKALNHFAPSPDHPATAYPAYRAPEILVIVGTSHFEKSLNRTENLESRPRAVPAVLEALKKEGLSPAPRLQSVLGGTRVIYLPQDQEIELPMPSLDGLSGFDRVRLRSLAEFRWGFTQQMAALMLKTLKEKNIRLPLKGIRLRRKLQQLARARVLRYAAGVYFLPSKVREELLRSVKDLQRARQHYDAGVALAPYVSPTSVPALAFDLAFLPEHVHEAGYHFEQAHSLAEKLNSPLAGLAKSAMQHIYRFVDFPHWHAQAELRRDRNVRKDAWDLGRDIIEAYEKANAPVHPVWAESTVRAGVEYLKDLRGKDQREEADEVRAQLAAIYADARKACERPEWKSSPSLLRVLSGWALFLMRDGRGEDASDLNKEIWSHLESVKGSTVLGEWYETQGDAESDPRKAAEKYGRGIRDIPEWSPWNQLWIKGLGAELLDDVPDSKIQEKLKGKTADELMEILDKAARGLKEVTAGTTADFVRARWRRGAQWFDEWVSKQFPSHRGLRSAVDRYAFLGRERSEHASHSRPIERETTTQILAETKIGQTLSGVIKLAPARSRDYNFIAALDGRDYQFNSRDLARGLSMDALQIGDRVKFTVINLPSGTRRNGKAGNVHLCH